MPARKRDDKQKNQDDLLARIKTIKSMFETVLKKNGGVGRIENYSGPEFRLRELRLILVSLNSLISNRPAITASNVNELCARLKAVSVPVCESLTIRMIGRKSSVNSGAPITSGLFEAKLVEEKVLIDGIQKGVQDILQSETMKELRESVGLSSKSEISPKP
ncbi:hypothetical protein AQUSIP_16110 [Aquicella siphonis]|uniref:Uncharacterized protein n=1 Tax=Aquicella siphonis TaxID=254247 RepID=A0A5E4PIU6_9COXI|nr:hypothetical protein [Aquicella siphonis]VVC76302.1 hypothetical protein AQUSIP_16110 [Aquicella siphonis]